MGRFEGKVAVVTGAAGGIGEAYARALAAEGAAVVVADLDEERGAATAAGIAAAGPGDALFVPVDVSDPDSTRAMADAAAARFGRIDHLVNNAAIYGTMQFDLLLSVDWDYYQRFMAVNLNGALLCTRACWKHLAESGGSIVNQSSTAAWLYAGFYGLAKAGINSLTQQLAHELGGSGVRVNAIAPGPTDTEATRAQVGEGMVSKLVDDLAIKRPGTPEDLVGMCLFLLSDQAAWVTGQVFNVDGGQVFR